MLFRSGCWLVHCSTVAAGGFPAPAGAANRAASSKAACCIRHRRRCFPHVLFLDAPKNMGPPTKSADFVGRGGAKERSGVLAGGGDGVEWISPRRRAVHGPKEKNRLKLNIRGIPIRGRAESHRAVLPIYLPATGALYCFAAGDEGVVHLSHAFLGRLLESRLLLIPSSLVPRLQGECSRGDRSPLLIGSGGNGTEWMPPHRGGVMEWNFRRCGGGDVA